MEPNTVWWCVRPSWHLFFSQCDFFLPWSSSWKLLRRWQHEQLFFFFFVTWISFTEYLRPLPTRRGGPAGRSFPQLPSFPQSWAWGTAGQLQPNGPLHALIPFMSVMDRPQRPIQRLSAWAGNILLPCLGGMTNERKKKKQVWWAIRVPFLAPGPAAAENEAWMAGNEETGRLFHHHPKTCVSAAASGRCSLWPRQAIMP